MSVRNFGKKKIGELLIEEGFLDTKNLQEALEVQKKEGGLIGSILVRMGWVSEEDLVFTLSKQLSIPFIRLSHFNINRNALRLIPKEVAERFLFFPFDEEDGTISFAMSDPLNHDALEAIEKRIPFRVHMFLATVSDIREAISIYYGLVSKEGEESKKR